MANSQYPVLEAYLIAIAASTVRGITQKRYSREDSLLEKIILLLYV